MSRGKRGRGASSRGPTSGSLADDYNDNAPLTDDIQHLFDLGFVSIEEVDYFDPKKVKTDEGDSAISPKETIPSALKKGWTVTDVAKKPLPPNTSTDASPKAKAKAETKTKTASKQKPKKTALPSSLPQTPAKEAPSIEDMTAWHFDASSEGLDPLLLAGLKTAGFMNPLEIQKAALKAYLVDGKRRILGSAPTGSGKTLAFGLPLLNCIYASRRNAPASSSKGPTGLIIVPTRELAVQIERHLCQVTQFTPDGRRLRIATLIGGLAAAKQTRQLSQHPEIIIATPGRLAELVELNEGGLRDNEGGLKALRFLVLDEADRLVQPGHFKELDAIVSRVMTAEKRPAVFLFSATLVQSSDPKAPFAQLLRRLHINAKELRTNGSDAEVIDLAGRPATLEELEYRCRSNRDEEKDAALLLFLRFLREGADGSFGRVLVFVNAIDTVRRLCGLLPLVLPANATIVPLHAQLQQRQRLRNLDRFKAAKSAILVATDVAARGLDIPGVEHVVHYHLPRATDTYIHRCGRTARGHSTGRSLALVSAQEAGGAAGRVLPPNGQMNAFLPNTEIMQHEALPLVRVGVLLERSSAATRLARSQVGWAEKTADDLGIILDEDNDPSSKFRRQQSEQGIPSAKELERAKADLDRLCRQFHSL